MTPEEKRLLLQDLCMRLPYGVKYKDARGYKMTLDIWSPEFHTALNTILYDGKPSLYLRPMSSMTEEEEKELMVLTNNKFSLRFDRSKIINMPISKIDGEWHCGDLTSSVDSFDIISLIDWLNMHHFDYRGLIEMGLALPAPEEMYNN